MLSGRDWMDWFFCNLVIAGLAQILCITEIGFQYKGMWHD